jgi:hypothetical protein
MSRKRQSDEQVLRRVADFVTARLEKVGFDGLTDNQRLFLCVHDLNQWSGDLTNYFTREDADLDAELGGKEDLDDKDHERLRTFSDYWGRWRDCAAAGLRTLGAVQAAKAFARARQGHWVEAEDRFRNAEDLDSLLLEFVRTHPEDFRPALDGVS